MIKPTGRIVAALLIGSVAWSLSAAEPPLSLAIRRPSSGKSVHVGAQREIAVPGDSSVIARSGFDPLLLPPGQFNPKTLESHGALAAVRGEGTVPLAGPWSLGVTGAEPRATLGDRDPFVVITGSEGHGYGTNPVHAMALSDLLAGKPESAALVLPTGLHSPSVMRAGMRLLAAGYADTERAPGVAVAPAGRGDEQALNLVVYDVGGTKPVLAAMIERYSDHAENNLAAGMTKDDVLHLIATEVLVSQGNRAAVRHLQFDTTERRWLPDQLLISREEFTSSMRPRLVVSDNQLDAFWTADGGSEKMKSDGLYAHRIGEASAWRLVDSGCEFAVLPNADGHGAMLVGVAVRSNEDGRIRWFVRRGDTWKSAGESDFHTTLYTMTMDGSEPFALWRDRSGTIRASFNAGRKLLIVELALPQ